MNKHVCLRLSSDPYQSSFTVGNASADEMLYQVAVPISDEEESEQETLTFWPDQLSDKFLYEDATQFSDEEWNNQMATDEEPESLFQPPWQRDTMRATRKQVFFIIIRALICFSNPDALV